VFTLGHVVAVGLLWFYWKGYSGARWAVLLISTETAINALASLTRLHVFRYLGAVATGGTFLNTCHLCLSLCFVAWLLSPEASKYFTKEARHERLSLAAYEESVNRNQCA
jgi:hypothetical protein